MVKNLSKKFIKKVVKNIISVLKAVVAVLLNVYFLVNISYSDSGIKDDETKEFEKIYEWINNMRDIDKNVDLDLSIGSVGNYNIATIPHVKKILQIKANKDASNLDNTDVIKWRKKLGIKDNESGNFNKLKFDELNNRINKANSGVASVIATASTLKNLGNGKHTLSGSIGYYGKEAAGAISYSTHYKNFGFGANASFNSRLEVGAGLGMSYTFGKDDDKPVLNSVEPIVIKEDDGKIRELENKIEMLTMLINNMDKNRDKEIKEIYFISGFDSGKFTLKQEHKNIIDSLISGLKDKEIIVVGYTDTDGTDKYNLNLGLNRAKSVKIYLENKGVKVKETRSAGFNELIRDNKTSENKALNRRVEIMVK
ncbi:OmpA family protein [Streptobacillus moniliformis]|uniref:OmpA family protein n=1 Tax=Streptobacillus moniliformis TaxID=34105 RepID=UPI0007EEA7C9|nr:OmpA family protein [Streptobacillus moniliformis]